MLYLAGVTTEFLPEPDWRCILQVRAPDFQDFPKRLRLLRQSNVQLVQRGNQAAHDALHSRNVQRRRNHIVA